MPSTTPLPDGSPRWPSSMRWAMGSRRVGWPTWRLVAIAMLGVPVPMWWRRWVLLTRSSRRSSASRVFVTAQLATFDLDTGVMEIVNAGHPPPLWLKADSAPVEIECRPTRPAGLGTAPTTTAIRLNRDDAVVFRTDGIVEARTPAGVSSGTNSWPGSSANSTPKRYLQRRFFVDACTLLSTTAPAERATTQPY